MRLMGLLLLVSTMAWGIDNPGFEDGDTPWVQDGQVIASTPEVRTGKWQADFNGLGKLNAETLYQEITVPNEPSTLSFWLRIISAETSNTIAFDKLSVQIQNEGGAVLSTLATYSNRDKGEVFEQKTFDMTPYAGKTVRIYLRGKEDASSQTRFMVDDFELKSNVTPPEPSTGFEGGGAGATGGRGGKVIQVTNLNDSGTGSLRACMVSSGNRTCVFKVCGTINLLSIIYVNTPGGLTVAGQTACGGGIMLNGKNLAVKSSSMISLANPNMIIQYLKIRKGYNPGCVAGAQCGSGIGMGLRVRHVMIDHVSVSWTQDDGIGPWSVVSDITIQNSIVAEGLYPHATGIITGSGSQATAAGMVNIDLHHNFISSTTHRAPFLGGKSTREVNDIVYNTKVHSAQLYGCIQYDGIGNIRKRGPYSGKSYYEYEGLTLGSGTDACLGSPSIYLAGNIGWNQTNPDGDQWAMARQVSSYNGTPTGAIPTAWRRKSPLPDITYPITVDPVDTLADKLLSHVGASRRLDCLGNWVDARDAVDERLIKQYQTGTGNSTNITTEDQVGGFPVIAIEPPCRDSDADGMPDAWETDRGLNPDDAADRNFVVNGKTNLETYLMGTK